MEVKWLVEPEVFDGEAEPLISSLEKLNVEHVVTSFGTDYGSYLGAFSQSDCVVFYGSLQLGRLIQQKAKWIPGVYCNLKEFECTFYYPRFGDRMLNSNYIVLPYHDVLRLKKYVGKFVRPNSGFKTFTGSVPTENDMISLSFNPNMAEETLMIMAPIQEIVSEWRLVVVGGRIVASTKYKEDGKFVRETGASDEVLEYGCQVLDTTKYRYAPDPAWTLDICKTKAGDLKILEVGSFSCAGLYGCDTDAIVPEINKVALEEYQDLHE